MTITRQQRNSETNESKPSTERTSKLLILKTCQLLFSKDLSNEEVAYWGTLLDPIPLPSVRYAFEVWNRNGRFFPKPKDILEHCEAYSLSKENKGLPPGCPSCNEGWVKVYAGTTSAGNEVDPKFGAVVHCPCFANPALRRRDPNYGRGYGSADMSWLYKRYMQKFTALPNRPMSDSEINSLLDELDRHRGESPAWRLAAGRTA